MKKRKRLGIPGLSSILAASLTVVLAASLIACSNPSQGSSNNITDPSTVQNGTGTYNGPAISYENCTLSFSWWGDAAINENTLAAIKAFEEKYPGITINASYGAWNGWEESMAGQFTAGITVPATLDELIAAGAAFSDKLGDDYYPLVLDENDKIYLMAYYLESIYGKPLMKGSALNYTEAELQTGLEFIQSLEAAHVIPPMEELINSDSDSLSENSKWTGGKYAGVFIWDYEAVKFEKALKKGQAFIAGGKLTDIGDSQGGFSKLTMAYTISETCEHPVEAALLIDFLLNQTTGTTIIGADRGIPLSQAALSACAEQGILSESIIEAHQKVLEYPTPDTDFNFEDARLTGISGVYFEVMAGLSYGMLQPQEAAKMLYNGIENAANK